MPTPDPVKLFVAVLYSTPETLAAGLALVERKFGTIDHCGTPVPFDHTAYYEPEMGPGLSRVLIGIDSLIVPEEIVAAKHTARDLEASLSIQGRRQVNLDVGYLDAFKVTLASFKGRGNKVFLGREVWLDVQVFFEKGKWHSLPWTFPDFRAGHYDADLFSIRAQYREQLRQRPFGVASFT
jgi:hypothetical protein